MAVDCRETYVGHQVDLRYAVDLVQSLFHGHRLPQPQRFAHELCTRAARRHGGE
ncbi:MAG TPA: endonuclease V [Planctomycetaceae bacterium]|nr:endonuclease V [Planctomycetaceae bacterium]